MGKPLKVRSDSVVKIAGKIARDDKGHGKKRKEERKVEERVKRVSMPFLWTMEGDRGTVSFAPDVPLYVTRDQSILFFFQATILFQVLFQNTLKNLYLFVILESLLRSDSAV